MTSSHSLGRLGSISIGAFTPSANAIDYLITDADVSAFWHKDLNLNPVLCFKKYKFIIHIYLITRLEHVIGGKQIWTIMTKPTC
jgi:hypothetical protein